MNKKSSSLRSVFIVVAVTVLSLVTGTAHADNLPNGESCSVDGNCASTFCNSGICCDRACTGACETCVGATPGTCTPLPLGTTPAECHAPSDACDGSCNGVDSECQFPQGAVSGCDSPMSCSNGVRSVLGCNDHGYCVEQQESCADYSCSDTSPYACKTSCSNNSDCIKPARCDLATQECVAPPDTSGMRKAPLYDPDMCSCSTPGRRTSSSFGWLFLIALITLPGLRRQRRRRATSVAISLTSLLTMLLACSDPQEPLPAQEVCRDIGYSIANRTQACSEDASLASKRWNLYEANYHCKVVSNDEPIDVMYTCPIEILKIPCSDFLAYGDNFDTMFATIPECALPIERTQSGGAGSAGSDTTVPGGANNGGEP